MKLKLRSTDVISAGLVTLLVIGLATYLPNLQLLIAIARTPVPFSEKLAILFGLAGSLGAVATIPGIAIIVISSLLIGINTVLLVRVVASRRTLSKASVGIGIGALLGALGSACAACGFLLILGSTVGTIMGAVLVALPFHGLEFGIAGVLVLLTTTAYLIVSLQKPVTCNIE